MRITQSDRKMAKQVFETYFKPQKSDEDIFYELMFCICAPQTTFKNNSKVVEELRRMDFYWQDENEKLLEWLKIALKPVRFFNNKSKWVAEAKHKFPDILNSIKYWSKDAFLRKMLVKDVKGLGMKTSSHFLRNLGATDLAIIDTHILKYLGNKWGMVSPQKIHSYEILESAFRRDAKRRGLTVAELDIIVWQKYSKTPWKDFVR